MIGVEMTEPVGLKNQGSNASSAMLVYMPMLGTSMYCAIV